MSQADTIRRIMAEHEYRLTEEEHRRYQHELQAARTGELDDPAPAGRALLDELAALTTEAFETRDTRPITQPLWAWVSGVGYPEGEEPPALYIALLELADVTGWKSSL